MDDGTRSGATELNEAVKACRFALVSGWTSAAQADRVLQILERFAGFAATGFDVRTVELITPDIASAFVLAPDVDASTASVALQHLRRTALRLLFRAARQDGADVGDPTLDLALPPRSPLSTRPLTDDEIAMCRSHALWSLADSRHAATWALAEATCRTSELANVTIGGIDLDHGRVWIAGGPTTAARFGVLTEWGATQVGRRIREVGDDPAKRLVDPGLKGGEAGHRSARAAILDVLTRSGLATEPDVRPASIAGWAGRRILTETGRIDLVARRLGMASLDRAARFIAWNWNHPEKDGFG